MSGANSGKAFFTNTDTGGQFRVQFNPKEFKLDEKTNWKASGEHATSKPLLTFEKGEPSTVSMDLIFDTTDNMSDVYKSYVEPLRDFLTADVPVKDQASGQIKGMRPPYCLFTWGNFTFQCVIEKVSCTFLMFKSDGTPVRAKVQLGLKEHIRENTSFGAGGGVVLTAGALVSGSGANTKTYTTMPGDTLNSVASRFNASPQDIALANNVPDGMEFPPNTPLVIPATPELARVLAQQSLKYTPAYWTSDRKLEPYDVFAVPAGDTAYVPSAFEDESPVAQDYAVAAQPEIPYASFNQTYGGYGDSQETFGVFSPQTYGDYGESDFTFGQSTAQTYGNYGDSEDTTGTSGQGADLGGGFGESDAASSFDNLATPDEQGARATAQEYGGYGESQDTTGTSGQGGGEYGGYGDSDEASSFDNNASPDEQGARATGQEYGGYGDSEDTTGTSGQGGGEYGGYGDSDEASSFDNNASPDTEGKSATPQSYGGYGDSDTTTGTSGQGGGGYGGYGDSDNASSFDNNASPDTEGKSATPQSYGGHGDSDSTGIASPGAGGSGSVGTVGTPTDMSSASGDSGSKPGFTAVSKPGGIDPAAPPGPGAGASPAPMDQSGADNLSSGNLANAGSSASSSALQDALRRVEETADKQSKD